MQLIAKLDKPFTYEQGFEFSAQYLTKEIKETEEALEAWDFTDAELIERVKKDLLEQNNVKAKEARYNQNFSITVQGQICDFDTSDETQRDLLTAFDVCSTGATYDGWITNNGVELNLTLEDILLIFSSFKELSNVYPKWKQFKEQIDSASTLKKVNAINIDYNESEEE